MRREHIVRWRGDLVDYTRDESRLHEFPHLDVETGASPSEQTRPSVDARDHRSVKILLSAGIVQLGLLAALALTPSHKNLDERDLDPPDRPRAVVLMPRDLPASEQPEVSSWPGFVRKSAQRRTRKPSPTLMDLLDIGLTGLAPPDSVMRDLQAALDDLRVASLDDDRLALRFGATDAAELDIFHPEPGRIGGIEGEYEPHTVGELKRHEPRVPFSHHCICFDKDELRLLVGRSKAEVHACYEAALDRDANASGKIVVHWTIDAKGRARKVTTTATGVIDDELGRCVGGAIRRLKFPVPHEDETIAVNYPFVFVAR